MAWEVPGRTITLPASVNLSTYQFCFVTADANGNAALPAGSTVSVMGVLQNKPSSNEAATIMIDGVSKVKAAGGTVAAGDLIASNSSGRAAAAGAGDHVVGRVLGGSSGSTDRVLTVMIQPVGSTQ